MTLTKELVDSFDSEVHVKRGVFVAAWCPACGNELGMENKALPQSVFESVKAIGINKH